MAFFTKIKRGKEPKESEAFRRIVASAYSTYLYPLDVEQQRAYRKLKTALNAVWNAIPADYGFPIHEGLAIILEELEKHDGTR